MQELNVGDIAPDFELPTDGGGTIRLSQLRGNRVVLYFYPKDNTSGCTVEASDFTRNASSFAENSVKIIGVSPDSVRSHDRFKAKYELKIILAADEERKVCEAYGVWVEKSMYGRRYMGVERTTFLIGTGGAIEKVWRKVKVAGHAEEVLAAAIDG